MAIYFRIRRVLDNNTGHEVIVDLLIVELDINCWFTTFNRTFKIISK